MSCWPLGSPVDPRAQVFAGLRRVVCLPVLGVHCLLGGRTPPTNCRRYLLLFKVPPFLLATAAFAIDAGNKPYVQPMTWGGVF